MMKIGFCFVKGGTGKTTLASSAVLYLNAVAATAGLIDASPVPMASLLLAAGVQPGVHAGREDIPVAVTRSPDALDAALRSLERLKASIAVIDLPPMAKTPRLDVAVVVADPLGLEFLEEFKADAKHTILVLNMAEERADLGRYKDAAAMAVLPYSPVVARAYARRIPPVLAHSPKAPRHGEWRRQFFRLMKALEEVVKKEARR